MINKNKALQILKDISLVRQPAHWIVKGLHGFESKIFTG